MKAVGVGFMLRKLAASQTPVLDISIDATGKWTISSISAVRTITTSFDLGKEFENETPDKRTVKVTVTLENGKLMTKEKAIKEGEKDSEMIREVVGDELHTTLKCDGVECIRNYAKQP